MTTFRQIISKVHSRKILRNDLYGSEISNEYVDNKVGKLLKKSVQTGTTLLNGENSLSEYTRTTNIEPRVMVEESLIQLPNMKSIMMFLTNLYSAYYLQAVTLNTQINGISVISELDKFNPNRTILADPDAVNKMLNTFAAESILEHGYCLPNYRSKVSNESAYFYNKLNTSLEAGTDDLNKEISKSLQQINDVNTLAVGRLLNVEVIINGTKVIVPVSVRMRPMGVPRLIMRELVSLGDVYQSRKERWHKWRAGEIGLADLIFWSDVKRDLRKLLALDKQGLYRELLKRRKNNKVAEAVSGKASIGAASSFIIIDSSLAEEIEGRVGYSLDSESFRNRVFGENSAMMIMVIDQGNERIKCYTRGISNYADYSYKDIESQAKGSGPDIAEIMKAYTLQQNPRF